jgi:hypothetical protein
MSIFNKTPEQPSGLTLARAEVDDAAKIQSEASERQAGIEAELAKVRAELRSFRVPDAAGRPTAELRYDISVEMITTAKLRASHFEALLAQANRDVERAASVVGEKQMALADLLRKVCFVLPDHIAQLTDEASTFAHGQSGQLGMVNGATLRRDNALRTLRWALGHDITPVKEYFEPMLQRPAGVPAEVYQPKAQAIVDRIKYIEALLS